MQALRKRGGELKKILFFLLLLSSVAQAGICYREGMPIDLLTQCADQGDVNAQRNLGLMYFNGDGVTKDYNLAFRWYIKAAEQGDAHAQFNLGLMYKEASGVLIDDDKAFEWFSKAAEQGYADAQNYLGLAYAKGEGTPQDYLLSYMWLSLSAAQNNPNAIKFKDQIMKKMTPDQITTSQQMTDKWLTDHKKN